MTEAGSRRFVFNDVAVFDGMRQAGRQTVVVAGGHILAVGDSAVRIPGYQPVPGEGRTLLPGFIDCHVHLGLVRPARVLAGGVTTARDLGWPARKIFRLAGELASNPLAGPGLLAAGPMLTARGGYPARAGWGPRGTAEEVASAAEGVAAVRALADRGAAVIKVAQEPRSGPTLPGDVLTAIVAAAHGRRLSVSSHCGALAQLELALDAGVDELAHGLWSDEPIPGELIERMVSAGMVVIPTLHIAPSEARIGNLRRFFEAGGRVAYGTDMGNAGPPQGIDATELSLMVRAGLSPTEALAAGTAGAARHLGLAGVGRIAEGAVADLVLVEGDPLAGFGPLSRPAMVLRRGWRIGNGEVA
ncbi:MAG: amidohydrolase family protein [Actinomycetota bacterium]